MRPYVLLSCALSADGYLDDASPERLILSGPADLDRVDEVRAGCDAILVGAGTIRRDRPRLLIRDPARRAARVARGLPEQPLRVTLTGSGDLDRTAPFFTHPSPYIIYDGPALDLEVLLDDLGTRKVSRLLVEGGSTVLGEFLARDLANELHLAVAPFFVADPRAPRLNLPRLHLRQNRYVPQNGYVPQNRTVPDGPEHADGATGPGRMTLVDVRRLDDLTVSRYLLGPGGAEQRFLRWAIELSRLSPPSDSAFSVGAVIVGEDGQVLSTGYSREQEDKDHAEEVALRKLTLPHQQGHDPRLRHATIYSSLVPCGARASRPVTCVQHILDAGIPTVVYAWHEPPLFTAGDGAERLRAAGVAVTEIGSLSGLARSVNAHLFR
jgi:riboflavin biosynthesis pyrimidine reductase/pyrimidine deaminase RibD-like protein